MSPSDTVSAGMAPDAASGSGARLERRSPPRYVLSLSCLIASYHHEPYEAEPQRMALPRRGSQYLMNGRFPALRCQGKRHVEVFQIA
jgi:hypothetical protein